MSGCVEDDCEQRATGITAYCKDHQYHNWHGWFAWYPVLTLSGEWAWFSTIIRKRIVKGVYIPPRRWWQTAFWYRIPEHW